MSENHAPGAATAIAIASRGMPYYEKLRRDLRETLQRKRILDQSISSLDESILRLETAYLEETGAGNIIKGFDNYMKSSTTTTTSGGAGTATRRKTGITDADRIFSRSSAATHKDHSEPGSTISTPAAATPNSSFPPSGRDTPGGSMTKSTTAVTGNKKKKALDDDDAEQKPAKRTKITYGRD